MIGQQYYRTAILPDSNIIGQQYYQTAILGHVDPCGRIREVGTVISSFVQTKKGGPAREVPFRIKSLSE